MIWLFRNVKLMGRKEQRPQCGSKKITITENMKKVKSVNMHDQENLQRKLLRKKKSDFR